jgi:hypothetical protein
VLLIGLTLSALALAVYWSRRSGTEGFATPSDCLDVCCDAAKTGDASRYLSCLAEPLRAEVRQRFSDNGQLAEHLRLNMRDVKSWALRHPEATGKSSAVIDLEETLEGRSRWTRFRLERTDRGWLIAGIGRPEEKPLGFRYGEPIDEGRTGSQPKVEP